MNKTQQVLLEQIIEGYLDGIDESSVYTFEEQSRVLLKILGVLNGAGKYTLDDYLFYGSLDALSIIDVFKNIYEHPCPQNCSAGGIEDTDSQQYVYTSYKGETRQEQTGLLSLTAKDDVLEELNADTRNFDALMRDANFMSKGFFKQDPDSDNFVLNFKVTKDDVIEHARMYLTSKHLQLVKQFKDNIMAESLTFDAKLQVLVSNQRNVYDYCLQSGNPYLVIEVIGRHMDAIMFAIRQNITNLLLKQYGSTLQHLTKDQLKELGADLYSRCDDKDQVCETQLKDLAFSIFTNLENCNLDPGIQSQYINRLLNVLPVTPNELLSKVSKDETIKILLSMFTFERPALVELLKRYIEAGNSKLITTIIASDPTLIKEEELFGIALDARNHKAIDEFFKIDKDHFLNQPLFPLHAAAERADVEMTQKLLSYGYSANQPRSDGEFPIHCVIWPTEESDFVSDTEDTTDIQLTLDALLAAGATINVRNPYGATILHMAVRRNYPFAFIEHLISTPNINLGCEDNKKDSVYHYAVRARSVSVVQSLLTAKIDSDTVNDEGMTPLLLAIHLGQYEIFELLQSYNADITKRNKHNQTALHLLAQTQIQKGQIKIFQTLKDSIDINAVDDFGKTALHYAVENSNSELVKQILSLPGVLVDVADKTNKTPLQCINIAKPDANMTHQIYNASLFGILLSLMRADADIHKQDNNHQNLFTQAVNKQSIDFVRVLLGRGFKLETLHTSPVFECISKRNIAMLELLLNSKQVDFKALNEHGDTIAQAALVSGDSNIIQLLKAHGCDFNVRNKQGETVLEFILTQRSLNCADLLRLGGINVNEHNGRFEPPLHIAFRSYFSNYNIEQLVSYGADVNAQNAYGEALLHLAVLNNHHDIISYLLQLPSTDINIRNKMGQSALDLAYALGNHGAIAMLENPRSFATSTQDTASQTSHTVVVMPNALHLAVYQNQSEQVTMLVGNNANVNAQDHNGVTPLHVACMQNFYDMAKQLLHYNANPLVKDKNGFTPLQQAIIHNHINIAKLLISAMQEIDFEEMIEFARKFNRDTITVMLISREEEKTKSTEEINYQLQNSSALFQPEKLDADTDDEFALSKPQRKRKFDSEEEGTSRKRWCQIRET